MCSSLISSLTNFRNYYKNSHLTNHHQLYIQILHTNMGNAEQQNHQNSINWLKQYEIVEENLHDNIMLIQSVKTGEEFYGKVLTCNNQAEVQKIDRLMNIKSAQQNKFLSKIMNFDKKDTNNFCNVHVQYSLVFEKGDFSLKDEIYNRKFKFQQFQQAQIMLVLESVMKGLLFLKQIKQPHRRVCTQNIFIRRDRSIFLSDPWLYPSKETSIFKMNETGYNYPSPQKILYQNDLIDFYDQQLSDYFSLGIFLLELINMEPMDHIYEKGFRRVLDRKIMEEIKKIKRNDLRERVQILVNHYPQKRKEIQKLYTKTTQSSIFINNEIDLFKKMMTGNQEIALGGKVKVQKNVKNRTQSNLTVSNLFSQNLRVNNNNTFSRPKIVFTHNATPQIQKKFQPQNQKNKMNIINLKKVQMQSSDKQSIPQNQVTQNKAESIKQVSIEAQQSEQNKNPNSPENCSFDQNIKNSSGILKEINYKKLNSFRNMIKQAQSINVSVDEKSQIVSEVIGHGFSAKNSVSIGLNSKRQSIDEVRRSMPQQSIEELLKPQPKIAITHSIPPQKETIFYDKKQTKVARAQQNTLTPDRRPVKKRNHSTIKEVSEQSPSIQSHSFQFEQRTIEYDVGTKYIGQLKNSKRHGQGIFYFQDGSYYQGSWKDNKMHGKGRLYYSNGQLAYEGGWYMDSFHGKGRIYNDAPQQSQREFNYKNMNSVDNIWEIYDGDFFNQRKNGNGKLKLSNGQVFVGEFMDDKVNGQGKFYQLNGNVVHGKWVQGIMVKEYS